MRANFDNNRGGKFVLSSKTSKNKDFKIGQAACQKVVTQ